MRAEAADPTPAANAARYERERQFHDDRFAEDSRSANRFYVINESATAHYKSWLAAAPPEASFLDYGCGAGAYSAIWIAELGRRCVAVDLSEVAVERARERAGERGLDDLIDFRVMNAETLDFPDAEFDVVCGNGILHHLELSRAYREIARVAKPDGRGLFLEPTGHNPLINLYRSRTPEQRTPDEHPLLDADFDLAREYFEQVETTHFALVSLLGLTLPRAVRRRSLTRLDALDRALFGRYPRLGRYGWLVVLELGRPRAPT